MKKRKHGNCFCLELCSLLIDESSLQPLRLDVKRKLSVRSDRVKSVDIHPNEPWILVTLYNGHAHIYNHDTQVDPTASLLRKTETDCWIPSSNWSKHWKSVTSLFGPVNLSCERIGRSPHPSVLHAIEGHLITVSLGWYAYSCLQLQYAGTSPSIRSTQWLYPVDCRSSDSIVSLDEQW